MNVQIGQSIIKGTVRAPSSKSAAHRALICAALADGRTRLAISDAGEDILATARCLNALCADVSIADGKISVEPGKKADEPLLDCGESGSTLRFLLPVAWALGGASFVGRGRLPERPLGELMTQMEAHGAVFSGEHLPFTVRGGHTAGAFKLPGGVSSQYVTGLLLAAPLLKEDVTLRIEGTLQSEPYVDMTLRAMRDCGVQVRKIENGYFVRGGQRYFSLDEGQVEGDWSSAAFILALGALCGTATVTGLDVQSAQGDRRILPLLQRIGAVVHADASGVTAARGTLCAIEEDVSAIPDLVPVLCALLMHAKGVSRLTNAGRLRYKESDRLKTCAAFVNALGGQAQIEGDSLVITGAARAMGGRVDGAGDHRIVMAAAVAASACAGRSEILGAQAVAKSYPGFFTDFMSIGGNAHGIDLRP